MTAAQDATDARRGTDSGDPIVDAVVVSYNSRGHLRASVGALADLEGVRTIVVDNDSVDGTAESISDLPVTIIRRADNGGFARACNEGMAAGSAPFVLFVNPDAVVSDAALRMLLGTLERRPDLGAAAPRIEYPDGSLAYSLRRFPDLLSTYAQALYLHRLFPRAAWATEIVRDERRYEEAHVPAWVSGACVLARRTAMEEIGGWDERFFLYCEDTDLCLRLHAAGHAVGFEPRAVVVHEEGASSNTALTIPLLAAAKLRYAETHETPARAAAYRVGLVIWSATRVAFTRAGSGDRRGHARALRTLLRPRGAKAGLPAGLR
jgi:N-acetylglucosaminyl-diphospho-decaprenol L-rhamnosyltransferase